MSQAISGHKKYTQGSLVQEREKKSQLGEQIVEDAWIIDPIASIFRNPS